MNGDLWRSFSHVWMHQIILFRDATSMFFSMKNNVLSFSKQKALWEPAIVRTVELRSSSGNGGSLLSYLAPMCTHSKEFVIEKLKCNKFCCHCSSLPPSLPWVGALKRKLQNKFLRKLKFKLSWNKKSMAERLLSDDAVDLWQQRPIFTCHAPKQDTITINHTLSSRGYFVHACCSSFSLYILYIYQANSLLVFLEHNWL